MTIPLVAYRIATSILAPIYRWQATRGLAPAAQIQRLGYHKSPRAGVIWCQAPSVGELDVLAPLLPDLQAAGEVLITTHSTTGAQKAANMAPLSSLASIDTPAAAAQFIATWQPRMAVFVESDMPANMLQALAAQGIPTALIAARASKTRRRVPKTVTRLLRPCALITASTDAVAEELRALGLHVEAVEDLKSQGTRSAVAPDWAGTLRDRPVWLAASTHPEDRQMVFAAHDIILRAHPDALLIIAPRHPDADRTWVPAQLAARFHSTDAAPDRDSQVFVMDALGQMSGLHALAPVTYLGGGTGDLGGHSPWEAASAGSHIITGPKIQNNAAAFDQIPHHTASDAQSLATTLERCMAQPRPAPVTAPQGTKTRDALRAVLAAHPA